MSKFNSQVLLNELKTEVNQFAKDFELLLENNDPSLLQTRPEKNKWSALECIEHLNMTGRYYLPKIQEELEKGVTKRIKSAQLFKSGFMGNYMYNSMKPVSGEIKNKTGTFKSVNPQVKYEQSTLDAERVCDNFRKQLLTITTQIEKAKDTDINKLKVPSLIGPILMFKLGDVFRFLLAHIERHLIQAKNAVPEMV